MSAVGAPLVLNVLVKHQTTAGRSPVNCRWVTNESLEGHQSFVAVWELGLRVTKIIPKIPKKDDFHYSWVVEVLLLK